MNWLENILVEIQLLFLKIPKQRHINKVFRNCKKITITELQTNPQNGHYQEVTIRTITSKEEIMFVSTLFQIVEGYSEFQMTISTIYFEFEYSWGGRKYIGLLCGGTLLNMGGWKGNAILLNPENLLKWLNENNI